MIYPATTCIHRYNCINTVIFMEFREHSEFCVSDMKPSIAK